MRTSTTFGKAAHDEDKWSHGLIRTRLEDSEQLEHLSEMGKERRFGPYRSSRAVLCTLAKSAPPEGEEGEEGEASPALHLWRVSKDR